MTSKRRSLQHAAWIAPLVLVATLGCVALPVLAPSPTAPLPTETPLPDTATPAPTSTPTVAPPTSTPTPTSLPPTATPSPQPTPTGDPLVPQGEVTRPPEGFAPTAPSPPEPGAEGSDAWVRDYVELVAAMLNSGRSVDEVLDTLTDWSTTSDESMGTPSSVAWAESDDVDDDGTDERLMSLPVPGRGCGATWCPSYLVLFEVNDGLFVPGHVVRGSPPHEIQAQNAELRQINDINGDGKTEILLQQTWCGAHTCFTGLTVGRWDGVRWYDLADGPISQSYTELTVEDSDEDGALEFTFFGGTFGSVGAGLQRPHTLVFDWQDGLYRLVEDQPAPSDHPYYLMLDANAALAEREWDRALELARRVVDEPDFSDPMVPLEEVGRDRIVGYAAVEAMLVHAQRGDAEAMEAVLARARTHDFMRSNVYTEAAQRLIGVYEETGDVAAACSAMEDVVAERPDEAVFFSWYGYNTARMTVDQVCPLDAPGKGESPDL